MIQQLIHVGIALGCSFLLAYPSFSQVAEGEPDLTLSNGMNLGATKVRGRYLAAQWGVDKAFTESRWKAYHRLRDHTMKDASAKVQWAMMNLESGDLLASSLGAESNRFYGASVTKVIVAAAYLAKKQGGVTRSDINKIGPLVSVSNNKFWRVLQREIGDGNNTEGMKLVQEFTDDLGLTNTVGFKGWLDGVHGNETTATDLVRFAFATFNDFYPGGEDVWKFMWTCRTGKLKGLKYLPADLAVGGKTGTYHGLTVEANSQKSYVAKTHHHLITFVRAGVPYAMAILSDRGSDEDVALMAGGLFREFVPWD